MSERAATGSDASELNVHCLLRDSIHENDNDDQENQRPENRSKSASERDNS